MADTPIPSGRIPRPRLPSVVGFMLLVGFGLCAWGLFDVGMALWAYTWPTTDARVVSRSSEARFAGRTSYSVTVGRYEYEVDGETYVGHAYAFGVREWIRAPAEGSIGTVSFCPVAPGVAVMEPGLVSDHFLWLIVGGVILLVATAPIRLWRRRTEAKARYEAAKEAARERRG